MIEESVMSAEIAGMSDDHRSKRRRNWQRESIRRLPVFGHRNWIVIADSAFPDQSNPGICTVVSDSDQPLVAARVLDLVAKSRHLKATIYLDQELGFIQERDARGISTYRRQIGAQFFAALEFLRDPHAFTERIAQAKQTDWVVYTKRPFAGPQQVLDYVLGGHRKTGHTWSLQNRP